jgi:hypothetical protein
MDEPLHSVGPLRRFARAYAGNYVRASLAEIAIALAALTGEPHPLALGESRHPSGGESR